MRIERIRIGEDGTCAIEIAVKRNVFIGTVKWRLLKTNLFGVCSRKRQQTSHFHVHWNLCACLVAERINIRGLSAEGRLIPSNWRNLNFYLSEESSIVIARLRNLRDEAKILAPDEKAGIVCVWAHGVDTCIHTQTHVGIYLKRNYFYMASIIVLLLDVVQFLIWCQASCRCYVCPAWIV